MANDLVRELKEKLIHQNKQICQLKEKLITFDEILASKDELHSQYGKLKQWSDDADKKNKKIEDDLMNSLDCQTKKLRNSEQSQCTLLANNNKLREDNDRVTEEFNTIKNNENRLLTKFEDLETCKILIENESNICKGKVNEIICVVQRLTKALKCRENENDDTKRQLDGNKIKCDRLREVCKNLEMELECMKNELETVECQAKQTEENLKLERDSASNELEMKRKKLQVKELELDEAKRKIENEKFKLKKLEACVVDLRHEYDNYCCEMTNKIQKLQKESIKKDESLCCLKDKIVEMQRENECLAKEIESLKSRIHANQCMLEKMKRSTEMIEQIKEENLKHLEKDRNLLVCELEKKKKKIANLERQFCTLKEQMKCEEATECPPLCPPKACLPSPCSTSCPSQPQPKCGLQSSCSMSTTKCSRNRGNSCNEYSSKKINNEIKQLYCSLEQLKESAKIR